MPAAVTPNTSFLDAVVQRALDGEFAVAAGTDPSEAHAAVGFLTVQAAKHTGRSTGYVNTVVSSPVGTSENAGSPTQRSRSANPSLLASR